MKEAILLEKERLESAQNYEKMSRKLYKESETHYISYRYFTTIGARLNYVLSLLYSIFTIWTEHFHRVRRDEFNTNSLLRILKLDLSSYIYKIYWEYVIIWNKYKTFKNLGNNIMDILKHKCIIEIDYQFW